MLKTKRSGGPKTAAGKLASSQNALKNGVYAQALILPGESEQEFEQLHAQLVQDYAPQGAIEASLVYQLAKQIWKKMRLEHMEHSAMLTLYNRPLTESDIIHGNFKVGTGCLWLLNDFNMLTPELIDDCSKYIDAYRLYEAGKLTLSIEYLSEHMPEVHFLAMERSAEMLGVAEGYITDEVMESWQIPDPKDKTNKILLRNYLFEYLEQKSLQVMRVEFYLEHCQNAVRSVRQRRLLNFMTDNKSGHAQQDLSREFYKILSELRRQQQWRMEHPRLEVKPNTAANTKAMH